MADGQTGGSAEREAAIIPSIFEPALNNIEVRALRWIEKVLAAMMVFIVIWGAVMVFFSFRWGEVPADVHKTLEDILSDIILLVVGLEIAILLIYRRIEYLIDIMLFVIARKMLVGANTYVEVMMGVAALAGLFAVRKYLLICPGCALPQSRHTTTDKRSM